ncbi:MAG TPA: tetratricopeptide repeat protein [Candidatus Eremiobacteraceae bacterium]|nr:tetratricopeptide repeat protein [Candidatus Eremiobacteraceae bacterium]
MKTISATLIIAGAMLASTPSVAATPADDPYASHAFVSDLNSGLTAFYSKEFDDARTDFNAALKIAPTDSLALSLMNAAVSNIGPDALDSLANDEEDAVVKHPKDAVAQTRLAYTYLFEAQTMPQRTADAKDALDAAITSEPTLAGAHVGLGIYRLGEDSTNRAKAEFLAALASQPHDILALEYLSDIYQNDLRDPQRALNYLIDVPNLIPNYADAYFHLGSIMEDLGQYDAGVAYLKTAINLDGGHVGEAGQFGLPLLGDMYLKLHELDLAKKAYADAVTFGEEPEYAKAQLERIRSGKIQ